MARIRRLGVLFTAVALAMSLAVPGVAQGPKHTSCKDFGHLFALFAQNPELFGVSNAGEGISFNARNEVELFGQTFTPPGSIAAIVHYEQNELGFCKSP
ncbi:MAG TPA: hypothetical protein VMP13_03765 [Acidimicrobiia bacterium]|nr:hypothetical protein [Acidimicrobiia bacterium]